MFGLTLTHRQCMVLSKYTLLSMTHGLPREVVLIFLPTYFGMMTAPKSGALAGKLEFALTPTPEEHTKYVHTTPSLNTSNYNVVFSSRFYRRDTYT